MKNIFSLSPLSEWSGDFSAKGKKKKEEANNFKKKKVINDMSLSSKGGRRIEDIF